MKAWFAAIMLAASAATAEAVTITDGYLNIGGSDAQVNLRAPDIFIWNADQFNASVIPIANGLAQVSFVTSGGGPFRILQVGDVFCGFIGTGCSATLTFTSQAIDIPPGTPIATDEANRYVSPPVPFTLIGEITGAGFDIPLDGQGTVVRYGPIAGNFIQYRYTIPEPSTGVLLGVGLLLTILWRRYE